MMDSYVKKLETAVGDPTSLLSLDCLLDTVNAMVLDVDIPSLSDNKNVSAFLKKYKNVMESIKNLQLKPEDFQSVRVIGKGGFGRVDLVRHRETNKIYALKTMNKCMLRPYSSCCMTERDIMVLADSPWIVQLFGAFQDTNYLYLVMEFVPGGDLYREIIKGKMPVDFVKFYIAELLLALDVLHCMGYVHRDVKPENIMLDRDGHIKLIDFSLCMKMDKDGLVHFARAGGSFLYMAPECLEHIVQMGHYGREIDWWAVGVTMYELLAGEPPFSPDTYKELINMTANFSESITFPNDVEFSEEAKDLICSLLSPRSSRLGCKSVDEIKAHTFFRNNKWTFDNIRQTKAPIVPRLGSKTDKFYPLNYRLAMTKFRTHEDFRGNQLPFVGFTYCKKDTFPSACSSLAEQPQEKRSKKKDKVKLKEVEQNLKQEQLTHEALKARFTDKDIRLEFLKGAIEELEQQLEEELATKFQLESRELELEKQYRQIQKIIAEHHLQPDGYSGRLTWRTVSRLLKVNEEKEQSLTQIEESEEGQSVVQQETSNKLPKIMSVDQTSSSSSKAESEEKEHKT